MSFPSGIILITYTCPLLSLLPSTLGCSHCPRCLLVLDLIHDVVCFLVCFPTKLKAPPRIHCLCSITLWDQEHPIGRKSEHLAQDSTLRLSKIWPWPQPLCRPCLIAPRDESTFSLSWAAGWWWESTSMRCFGPNYEKPVVRLQEMVSLHPHNGLTITDCLLLNWDGCHSFSNALYQRNKGRNHISQNPLLFIVPG